MRKRHNLVWVVAIIFLISSCMQDEKKVIATKIQYDVNIKSPDPDYDWWIQNLPGPQREQLVDWIIDGTLSGKLKAFDYFYSPLTKEEVASIISDTSYYTLINEDPPYEERDTVVVYTISKEDILRIRFLEEWKMDPNSLKTEKKVLGVAPIARRADITGTERWQPLFWIFPDDEFRNEVENSN
jgi:hypothetical protein